MPTALDTFSPEHDRHDSRVAARLVEVLWPDPNSRKACVRRLATSIRRAHGAADASWEVTMFPDSIRLNVGQVEVLTLRSDSVRALRVTMAKESKGGRSRSVYAAVPIPSRVHECSPAEVGSQPSTVWAAHEAFIDAAAAAKRVSPFKAKFSDGVIKYLEQALGAPMPRPAYFGASKYVPMPRSNHPVCVYAIRRGDWLEDDWRRGEPFSFQEGRTWTGAAKELAAAGAANATLPLLFADARRTSEVIFAGQIDDIRLPQGNEGSGTTITASQLVKLENPVPKTQLVLVSTGRRIPAAFIRSYAICRTPGWLAALKVLPFDAPPEQLDLPAQGTEGRHRYVTHLRRERNRALIDQKKLAVLKSEGRLACTVCGFDFCERYGTLGDGFCEVHHLAPLSEVEGEVTTSLEDLAIICANCHRIVHRGGENRGLSEVRAALSRRD